MNATGDALLSCVWATARTPAPSEWSMCTYPGPLDKYVSRAVQKTGCWLECDDVTFMQRLLRKAFRGMSRLLNASAGTFVGSLVEFDKITCCEELVSPNGAFWVLQQRHGLCAFVARVARPAQTTPTPLASLCSIRRNGRQINLRWQRCDG